MSEVTCVAPHETLNPKDRRRRVPEAILGSRTTPAERLNDRLALAPSAQDENPGGLSVTTAEKLRSRTVKDLAAMAKKKKVPGWHEMRKEELVRALVRAGRRTDRKRNQAGSTGTKSSRRTNGRSDRSTSSKASRPQGAKNRRDRKHKGRTAYAERRLRQIKAKQLQSKDLALDTASERNGYARDRLVLMVRDPYWLHAYWELSRRGIERAKSSLGQHWHAARPVLKLCEVARTGTTSTARRTVREIPIHGGVSNWYIDVLDPPKSFQVEIGYVAPGDRFFCLARSNTVTTPRAGSGDAFDHNWSEVAKDSDRIYAMSAGYPEQEANRELKEVFEERLRRPMGDPMSTQFGVGAGGAGAERADMKFHVDTELIIHGVAQPDAHVMLKGEPVHLRPDGTFAVRCNLPDRRHVLPVVASSPDGVEQRTIVLAIDRNTKVMEPVLREPGG